MTADERACLTPSNPFATMAAMPGEFSSSSPISQPRSSDIRRALALASQSPRRAAFLRDAGYDFVVVASGFVDDPAPPQGREPLMLAIELASRKTKEAVLDALPANAQAWLILGADTIAAGDDNVLLGKPESKEQAATMIRGFINKTHRVITGVSLWLPESEQEEVFADVASVQFGEVTDQQLQTYLATDAWRGKAGGYNLAHVRELGWDVTVTGDEATVMGLPMQKLVTRLSAWGVRP